MPTSALESSMVWAVVRSWLIRERLLCARKGVPVSKGAATNVFSFHS